MKTLYESILDNDLEQKADQKVYQLQIWKNLCGNKKSFEEEASNILQYVISKKCKKFTTPTKRGTVRFDPYTYYIVFGHKNFNVERVCLAYGGENLYTWDVNKFGSTPDQYWNIHIGKIDKYIFNSFSQTFSVDIYELPKELMWLYEKIKDEV